MTQLDSRVGTMDFVGEKPVRSGTAKKEDRVEIVAGLAGYLSKLGLADGELDQMITMLQSGRQEQAPDEIADDISMEGAVVVQEPVSRPKGTIGLFLAEEQQILREAYQSVFSAQPNVELLGSTADTSTDFLAGMVQALKPDVIILGVKAVHPCTVEKLEALREACPQMGLVLLLAMYDGQGIKALREFSRDSSTGCAYLLKHTIDTVEQLTQVVSSVAEGRIIVDPMVMEELIRTGDTGNGVVQELSPKEMEVLGWLAKGYRNDTIAGLLSRDVKTVERHINNIYSKLQSNKPDSPDATMHPRVRAALMYLKAVGLLSGTEDGDE
jgi:DNA-binding NarL/FixJ family response regulator